ncbi:MAG: VanZ family protein, partial [Syntrophales bacterium]|nr:VanZ family protein [Syntrophales bacterium]
MNTNLKIKNLRIILWLSVAIYTLSLPYAIVACNVIALRWSPEFAEFVPRLILLVAGAAYIFYSIKVKLPFKKMSLLIPCAIISCLIIYLEPNPNKHIHIPEYVLMTWLLFEAIRIDYKGAGIFLLVFLCSSFLGVLDEIFQGIHPLRFYGWQDMIINSSSSFIGILSLIGLREDQKNWNWINQLKKMRGSLFVVLLGILSAAVSCYMLFKV